MDLLRVLFILLVIYLVLALIRFTTLSKIDKYNFSVCNVIKDLSESYHALVRKKNAA